MKSMTLIKDEVGNTENPVINKEHTMVVKKDPVHIYRRSNGQFVRSNGCK